MNEDHLTAAQVAEAEAIHAAYGLALAAAPDNMLLGVLANALAARGVTPSREVLLAVRDRLILDNVRTDGTAYLHTRPRG
jgi:hypothetical protein